MGREKYASRGVWCVTGVRSTHESLWRSHDLTRTVSKSFRWADSIRWDTVTRAGMLVVMVVFLTGTGAIADTLHLRGGEKLIGKVISDDKTQVVFESQVLGRLKVSRERIELVEFDAALTMETAAGPSDEPFSPPAPIVEAPPMAGSASTDEAAAASSWYRQFLKTDEPSTDWIQLKSGEWLRGTLHGMQNRKVEFESDELGELTFDWEDVHQVIMPQALVSYGERESAWGMIRVDRENVTVIGGEEVTFSRYDLVGIAPGSPREIDYWSGRLNVGVNLRSGNSEQADLVTSAKLERRTEATHFQLSYVGNFSEIDGVETVNNQRATELFDIFLTRRLFLRGAQAEYYYDPFQNIDAQFTAGVGIGYYFIDTPVVEWLVAGGPGYRYIRYAAVGPGETDTESTPVALIQSNIEIELTKRTDFEVDYQLIVANDASGGDTHHATVTVGIDLTSRLELDLSLVWDRMSNPRADADGIVPEKDDVRLNLSLGIKF